MPKGIFKTVGDGGRVEERRGEGEGGWHILNISLPQSKHSVKVTVPFETLVLK